MDLKTVLMEYYVVLCDWMKYYQPYKISEVSILTFLYRIFHAKMDKNTLTVSPVKLSSHNLQWEETAFFPIFLEISVPLTPPIF